MLNFVATEMFAVGFVGPTMVTVLDKPFSPWGVVRVSAGRKCVPFLRACHARFHEVTLSR